MPYISVRRLRASHPRIGARLTVALLLMSVAACDSVIQSSRGTGQQVFDPNLTCSVPRDQLFDGGPGVDGIPALQNPPLVGPDDPQANYLLDGERVIGILAHDQAVAIPHNILWWHEIVNLDLDETPPLSVTYCPLTGSSMVFDRGAAAGSTFGVSGLIFQNNLVLWDRREPASLWSQMGRRGICGAEDGREISMVGAWEMTWGGWKELHPETLVISGALGMGRDYTHYPYGRNYESPTNDGLLFPHPPYDRSRPPKERLLGIPSATRDGGLAFPFPELAGSDDESSTVVHTTFEERDLVVFWDSGVRGGMAYLPIAGGTALSFSVQAGAIVDDQTGSEWRVDGLAVAGPLEGERLELIDEAYVAFWFAWATFQPETEIWTR